MPPGFDYQAEAVRIKDILDGKNATTTVSPYLSQDLSTTVKNVYVDDPERTSVLKHKLPAIYIRARLSEEEFHGIGATGTQAARSRKEKTVTWEIFGLYLKDGFRKSNISHLAAIHDFARNVEAVFQDDPRLTGTSTSATCLWVNPKRTDFGDVIIDGNIVKGFRIDLEGQYLFK